MPGPVELEHQGNEVEAEKSPEKIAGYRVDAGFGRQLVGLDRAAEPGADLVCADPGGPGPGHFLHGVFGGKAVLAGLELPHVGGIAGLDLPVECADCARD